MLDFCAFKQIQNDIFFKLIVCIFYIISSLQLIVAQADETAALRMIIERNTQDATHVNALVRLAQIYYPNNSKEAEKLADKALEIAIRINYDEGLANALTILGDIDAYHHNSPERALEHHERAYQVYKKLYQEGKLDKWKIYQFLKEHAIPAYRVIYAKNHNKKRYQKLLIRYQQLNTEYVDYLATLASETRSVLDKTESELKDKEKILADKEEIIQSKDDEIRRREREIQEREKEIKAKERELRKSRAALSEKSTSEELLQQINEELLTNLGMSDSAKRALNDKILAQEYILEKSKRKIAEQKLKLEHEQQARERRNILIGVIIFVLVAVLVVVIIIYRSYQKQKKAYALVKKQKERLEEQQRILKAQKEELEQKNQEILQKSIELVQRNEEIMRQAIEIQEQKEELERQNAQISEQYVEIEQINVEILAQRDALEQANRKLETLNRQLQEANNDVKASITYAQRIQNALLPQIEEIKSILPEFFILFQPRDIVSGDFYWIHKKENAIFIAAIDCTGHGVPGAFMSMLADALLTQIIIDKHIHSPEQVLGAMHEGVRQLLRQAETGNRDGMDAALVVWYREQHRIEFAGAKNPLFLVKTTQTPQGNIQELVEIKGDISPIGGQQKEKKPTRFQKHVIDTHPYHTFYIFSDGYQDQFGGEKGRKFMVGNFKKLITEIAPKKMNVQKAMLIQRHEEWKGDLGQVDDILIIGVRIGKV
ncbi:MAG: SpoIIE family protein phosphatase [Microscillaceae bacterium]|nr:SpoIIE family protein phosphatase [Microscillaceae bacterium]MDW8459986.1 SpoIIE family protein phosphatase [Cytophagales bacterium]